MSSTYSRLPSLKALRALEALDRLGSAGAVADEMALTRSAVSHMLRRLEGDLEFPLTEPDGRGLRLTARAKSYAREARNALDIIAGAAAVEPILTGELKVTAPPGLAAFWLADRIGAFALQHPEVSINLSAARTLGDMAHREADVQIAFGDEANMDDDTQLLARVSLFPICAPAVLSMEPGLRKASDLSRFRLLHLISHVDWVRWFEAAGVNSSDPGRGIVFSDMPMVHMAAAAGQGVALGDSLTARAALDSGQMVRPFSLSIPSRWSYFMRVTAEGPAHVAAAAFAAWVRDELEGPDRP